MSGVVIGTNTITIDGKFLETGKYNTLIQEPSSSPSVNITNIDGYYKYMAFTYTTGTNNTAYTITFNENTECDILIVGGGGAGGWDNAGGGGAGGLVFIDNFDAFGVYNIVVGKGGVGRSSQHQGFSGQDSVFNNGSIQYIASGGGGGGGGDPAQNNGKNGGSGGGSAGERDPDTGGVSNQLLYNNGSYDRGFGTTGGTGAIGGGGGGGGSFELGQSTTNNLGAVGGDGKYEANGINFKNIFRLNGSEGFGELYDNNIYFAGGGGGGNDNTHNSIITNGIYSNRGGFGGGARGATNNGSGAGSNGFDALDNSGGGGGGGQFNFGSYGRGGHGGSGIVIIRYRYANDVIQWTYSSSNPNVYLLGNVGIGTTNPTSALQVLGSVQINGDINASTLNANTKNFKIEHPLNLNKWLYHGCVEAPRFDNIYRGKKLVINGTCEVNIDEECNTTGGLTKGTFVSLNTNFSLYLQNKKTYDSVKGKITDGILIINCENIKEEIEIDWLVIGERKDENIIINELTNYNGSLICEYDMD